MCLKGEGQGSKGSFHLPVSRPRTAGRDIAFRFGHLRGLGAWLLLSLLFAQLVVLQQPQL